MRKIATLFVIAVSFLLHANAQDTWNAVKLFDFNSNDVALNMYIDPLKTEGEPVFCFLTSIGNTDSSKLIKMDLKGTVIDAIDIPYKSFTVFNGDTLFCRGANVINSRSGERIYGNNIGECCEIASSDSNVFVHIRHGKRSPVFPLVNILTGKKIYETWNLFGLCCVGELVYIIDGTCVTSFHEDGSEKKQVATISIDRPAGIAEYRGTFYVYSRTDKAVYRLEPSEGTAVYSVIEPEAGREPVHYGLDGRKIEPSVPGIHILRFPDGRVNKIVVR